MLALLCTLALTTVRIQADRHWGVVTLDHAGQHYIEDVGSANNSVIFFADGTIAGGAPFHGNWTLDRATIFVDGEPLAACVESLVLDQAMISRTSTLYDAVRLTATTFINPDGIDEHFVFDGLDTKPVSTLYAALGSRANRLTEWAAFDAAGLLLSSGSTAADNNGYTYLPANTKRVAQYDPLAGNGLIATWAFEGSASVFIVDRSYDNKLYLRVFADKSFEISQSLRFFEADQNWTAAVPEPSAFWLAVLGCLLVVSPRLGRLCQFLDP